MKALTSGILVSILIFNAGVVSGADDSNEIVSVSIGQIQADQNQLDDHKYISTGQPDSDVLTVVADAGFKTVIDLRGVEENRGIDEPAEVARLGMQYVLIPVAGAEDINYENAAKLDQILAEADGPVFLHCASGNRVGALVALRARMNGASADDALMLGKKAGLTRAEDVVKVRLAEH